MPVRFRTERHSYYRSLLFCLQHWETPLKAPLRILVVGIILCSMSACAGQSGSASITINGKTVDLPHARAVRGSAALYGVPTMEVFFAEKDLGVQKLDADQLKDGKHGVVLHFDCSPYFSNGAKNTDKVQHYRATTELLMDYPFLHWKWRN